MGESPPFVYGTTIPATSLRALLATPTLHYTDLLDSSLTAQKYRTIRVVFMLLDDDFRPNVAATAMQLLVNGLPGSAVSSSCGTSQSASSQHVCSLALNQEHFSSVDTSASLQLTTASGLFFAAVLNLAAIPSWVADHCEGLVLASCDSGGNFMYARGPSGPVEPQSDFSVQILLVHTGNAGVVNFRFQFDPTIVSFAGTSMVGSPYAAVQLSDPELSFSGTSFSTGYDALVSATTLSTTYAPATNPTLVCTLRFRALSAGDAFRMSVAQVLSVGDATLIDNNEVFVRFDVLGSQLALAPRSEVIGILAAMRSTVVNLQSVTGDSSSYSPYTISISSDYSGAALVSTIASPSCSQLPSGLQGCVSTAASLVSGSASVELTFGLFSTTMQFKTYAPTSVSVLLSRSVVRRLCTSRFQSATVRVFADGVDVT